MENRKKKNLLTSGVYIIVSFCFLVLIGFGVFTSLRAAFGKPSENEIERPKNVLDENLTIPVLPEISTMPDNGEVFEPELVPENNVVDAVEEPPIEEVKYVLPTAGKISKDFSKDTLVFSQTMNDYRTHCGVDFCCEYGEEIKCFSDGTVESFGEDPLNGIVMTVRHSDSLVSRYCNLSSELPEGVEVGSMVRAGDSIAFVGDPGILECAEGYHLHFEIERDGVKVNLNEFDISE